MQSRMQYASVLLFVRCEPLGSADGNFLKMLPDGMRAIVVPLFTYTVQQQNRT